MLLILIIWVIVSSAAFASFLSVCTFLSVWLAFGRTHLLLRMPLFLLCTLALGIVPVLAHAPPPSDVASYYVLGAVLVAASFLNSHAMIRVAIFAWGALTLVFVLIRVEMPNLDSSWIVRVALAMTLIASALALARTTGWRFVDLTEGVTGLEMERGTGRDLRQWISLLDAQHADAMKHAEIMALLRRFGFSFAWQKTITVAYERTLGRWDVESATNRRGRIIPPARETSASEILTWSINQRFTIWQMMMFTFCAACLFGFIRNFSWTPPTALDIKYVLPTTAGVAVNTVVGLYAGLTPRRPRRLVPVAILVAVVSAVGVSLWMGFGAISPWASVAFTTLLLNAFLVAAVSTNLSYQGYCLVRVEADERRATRAKTAESSS